MMMLYEVSGEDPSGVLWEVCCGRAHFVKIVIPYVVYNAVGHSSLTHRSHFIALAFDQRRSL